MSGLRLDPLPLPVPMTETRAPAEAERDQVVETLRLALNRPASWAASRGPSFRLGEFKCTFDGERVIATAAAFRSRQWFAGKDMAVAGIYAVATRAEHRGSGLASAAVEQLLRDEREAGIPVAALFPAVLRPYRRLGFEIAGSLTEHELALDRIPEDPPGSTPAVEPLDPQRDLVGAAACVEAAVRGGTGTIGIPDPEWFLHMVETTPNEVEHAVVVRNAAGHVDGVLSTRNEDAPGYLGIGFGLRCRVFAWRTEPALRALLAYLRSFRGLGRWMRWTGPPNDPLALLVDEQDLRVHERYPWMERILDVEAALEARGWPDVNADALFEVDDPLLEENRGPWHLTVRDGSATVSPAPSDWLRPIKIGTLSALFTGFLSASDAVRLGLIDAGDPVVGVFDVLFAGPAPWVPFHF